MNAISTVSMSASSNVAVILNGHCRQSHHGLIVCLITSATNLFNASGAIEGLNPMTASSWQHRATACGRGYGTQWRKLRDFILRRDCGLCQVRVGKGRLTLVTEVDHIIPKAKGGTDHILTTACISSDAQTRNYHRKHSTSTAFQMKSVA